ncbi:hypothetical protein PHYBOEH_007772 [Phytophthora boehmeriae]|uniref:PDZ domain-containing protein n=1 Tax=Phytophthora boehmeriae TaxID=109152 RepID=A0A8T1W519_9STRA|nr:hypothetical protein PHYBOEH_007772 [Phytophthora boehmeriae]
MTPDADSSMQDYLINWNAGPLGVVLRPDLGSDMPPVVAQLLPQPSVLKMAGVREGDLLISVNGKKTTRLGYEKVVRLLFKERLPMVLHFRSPLQELQRGVSTAIAEEPQAQRERGRTRTSSSAARPSQQPRRESRARGRSEVDKQQERRHPSGQNFSIDSATSSKSSKKKKKGKKKSKDTADADERRLRKQYSVVWERGSLGISFRAYNAKVNVPCVDFISTSRGQGRGMDRVCVNDVLIAINGEKTKALGVEKVLRWLHVIEKPVVLRFHASSNRITNPAGGLLPHLADGDTSARPRGPTISQPEYEPAPRPPRRNNSVDQPPIQQRSERGYSDDREYELHSSSVVRGENRRYSRDSAPPFEKQPNEPQYGLDTSIIDLKERRYTNNSMSAYQRSQDRDLPYEGVTGDFRREPLDDPEPPQFDLRIDAHIVPRRRAQYPPHEDANYYNQPQLLMAPTSRSSSASREDHRLHHSQLAPSRSRSSSVSREDRRLHQSQLAPSRSRSNSASLEDRHLRQQTAESKPPPAPVKNQHNSSQVSIPPRPRLASRDSQISNSSNMSFEEATTVVARATGKPVDECEFGGVPLLKIQEGTVQAKLMYIYAKACLAKEESSDDEPASKDAKLPRTPGNPLGRKTHSKYLSYTILQDDTVASSGLIPNLKIGGSSRPNEAVGSSDNVANHVDALSVNHLEVATDKEELQEDIKVKVQPVVAPSPILSVGPSNSISSDEPRVTIPPSTAEPVPAEDFISLKDFIVKGDGSLEERRTTSSINSTATPVLSTDGGEPDKTDAQRQSRSTETQEENTTETMSISDATVEDIKSAQPDVTTTVEQINEPVAEVGHEEKPTRGDEKKEDHVNKRTEEHDDAASLDSSNERDFAASVTSLDDLLDLPLKDRNGETEEQEEFVDDDEEEEEEAESNQTGKSRTSSLGMELAQVQEEEAGETEEHDMREEAEEEELEDGALTNPLVDELFLNVPDVREVVKDKPALVVLVKKSMIDEIQEILQSLQMELQFERHSIMGVGSTASPPRDSQHSVETEGQRCFRCGASGELAELNVADDHHELYCQDCWELFFFSEERQSASTASKPLAPSESSRLSADEDALDEALKYSFHDSSVTREDMIHPWRYLQGSDSMSSFRDSNASSITDRTDEVWL